MSRPDIHDRALETVLRSSEPPRAASPDCLDTETMAAWADGGLDTATLARAEAHMARCAHCQLVMAALMDTPSIDPYENAGAAVVTASWWRMELRWLMPLAGVLTALLLWVVMPDQREPARIRPADDVALSTPAEGPQPADPSATAPPSPPEAKSFEPSSPRAENKATLAERSETQATADRTGTAAAPRAARDKAPDLQAKAEAPAAEADAAAAAPAPPAPPAVAGAAREPVAATPPSAASPDVAGDLQRDRLAESVTVQSAFGGITSGDRRVRWRFADAGMIERSVDGGTSWTRSETGAASGLVAGSAPSATVCWVVGRGGLVLLTIDGRTWRRLSTPTTEDLVSVEADSERRAVVRTAAGAVLQTLDGGATWSRVPDR